jgi:hypothetical protein
MLLCCVIKGYAIDIKKWLQKWEHFTSIYLQCKSRKIKLELSHKLIARILLKHPTTLVKNHYL